MRNIGPYSVAETPSFVTLVGESTPDRRTAMLPLVARVTAACAVYNAAIPNVHGLAAIKLSKARRAALIDGYDGRSVAVKKRLAAMIDSLPPQNADLCPYCSLDTNPDLDHFLPKAKYPEFSLHGPNLVPICTPCNRKKLSAVKTAQGGMRYFLHPSCEPTAGPVLRADIIFAGSKVLVQYQIEDGGVLSPPERAQVERHFDRLGLAKRFTKRAHSYLAAFKANVQGAPLPVVTRTLVTAIASASLGEPVNGWKPALFRAIDDTPGTMIAWLLAP